MAEIVGVRFKDAGKVYYFDPGDLALALDMPVVVETVRGIECGAVAIPNREVDEREIVTPLKRVVRIATQKDLTQIEENRRREQTAFEICHQKIAERGMEMKLVDVEYAFDNSKILFYFTADGRVDFRELVKDLAGIFRTRIELRQIGVRDEAKMLGGLGICGRVFCCTSFLGEFQPVSIKMAKEQGLSLNPAKISGTCGRLMCCLKYEQVAYEDLIRTTPKTGSLVITPDGRGVVIEVSLLSGMLKVRLEGDAGVKVYHKDLLKGSINRCACETPEGVCCEAAGASKAVGGIAVVQQPNPQQPRPPRPKQPTTSPAESAVPSLEHNDAASDAVETPGARSSRNRRGGRRRHSVQNRPVLEPSEIPNVIDIPIDGKLS